MVLGRKKHMPCRNQRPYVARVNGYYTLEMTHTAFGKGTRSVIHKHLVNACPRWLKIANRIEPHSSLMGFSTRE